MGRDYHLIKTYGITEAQFLRLLKKQKNLCAVCQRPAEIFKKNLSVDHNHETREIRGILCPHCNRYVVGRHKTPHLLQAAADYLRGPYTGLFVPEKPKKTKRKAK